jgi:hypothetical protein
LGAGLDRVALGAADRALADFHVAPIKPHLGERDTIYPTSAEFGVRQLDPEIVGGFDFVDVWAFLARGEPRGRPGRDGSSAT